MNEISKLVERATNCLLKQKFCRDFTRKYAALWQKLILYSKKYCIDEYSWHLACMFLKEELNIDIEGSDIYSSKCKRIHYTTVRPFLYLLLIKNGIEIVRTTRNSLISVECFCSVLNKYAAYCEERNLKKSTIDGKMWIVRSFLMHLIQTGISSIDDLFHISKESVDNFIKFTASRGLNTLSDRTSVIKEFLSFLYDNHFIEKDLSQTIPKYHRCQRKLAHTWTKEELKRILQSIERNTSLGKRDYAIFMIATHLGMRIGDIISLKFNNINWERCSISFNQEKTGVPQELPLNEEVGKSIIEYLKNGRPKIQSSYLFIKHIFPYDRLHSFWSPMQKYLRLAKISVVREKPHGPHTLRFSLATHMMDSNIDYETISAILGHSNINSTNRYIIADIEKLRLCSLNPKEVV